MSNTSPTPIEAFFQQEIHSISTMENTDIFQQIGRLSVKQILPFIKEIPDGYDYEGCNVVAYELKNPTSDDRISLSFQPSKMVWWYDCFYMCIPRSVWMNLVNCVKNA